MLEIEISAFVAPVISAFISVFVAWVTIHSRLAVLEAKMDELGTDVRRHNNLVERMAVVEQSTDNIYHRLADRKHDEEELEVRLRSIETKIGGTE